MAVNQPAAFAALLAGGLMLRKGVAGIQGSFTGSAASGSSGTVDATGVSSDAKQIRDYLQANGLSKIAAAGIVGNLQQESGLDPNAAGGGLAQWQGARRPADMSLAGQLTHLIDELHQSYPDLIGQLNGAQTPAQAATMFSNRYERPDPSKANLPARMRYAQAAFGL